MKNELVRLDKALADEGIGTRREIKQLVAKGLVTVNDIVERDSGVKLSRESDIVAVRGTVITARKHIYLLMNKPAGVVSATEDSRERTVVDLVPEPLRRKGLFPAGRLDKDTVGMMILTDDGEFAHRILSPRSHVVKRYIATLDIAVTDEMKQGFDSGIELKGEKKCMPARLEILDRQVAQVTISEGMYHQIKRMFGCYGAKVLSLRRIAMGELVMEDGLAEGCCRELTDNEIVLLQSSHGDIRQDIV